MTSPHFPSRLAFGSYLVYCSRGESAEIERSKQIIFRIKADKTSHIPSMTMTQLVAAIIAREFPKTPLGQILTPRSTLVPMPRSAKLLPHAVWGARSICQALIANGLGRDWQPLLERTASIRKSAFSDPGNRPNPREHYDSLWATASTIVPDEIVLVDDIITKGSTLIGGAARIAEVYPGVPIRAFAVARTISQWEKLEDPRVGVINAATNGMWSRREP